MKLIPSHAQSINLIQRGFHIRYGTIGDIGTIDHIARQYPKQLAFVRRVSIQRAIDKACCHVAIADGELVGFVLFNARRDGWQTIYDLAVDRNYADLGIGRNLLYSVPCPIRLKCKTDNDSAIRFYQNAGMQIEKQDDKLTRFVLHHLYIFCAGNNKTHPYIAREIGMAYGTAQSDKPYDFPFMMDVEFKPDKQDWQDYMHKICQYKPVQAMVTDYIDPSERERLYRQIDDLKNAGVMRIKVCPKFDGAIQHIPDDCIIALSIPTQSVKFGGWLPKWQDMKYLKGRKIHLLGGSPFAQTAEIDRVNLYGGYVVSLDGNQFHKVARWSEVWLDGRWYRDQKGNWEFGDREQTMLVSGRNIVQYINQPDTWLSCSSPSINKKRYKMRQLELL